MPLHPRTLLAGTAALALASGAAWWWHAQRSPHPSASSNPQSAIANPQSQLPLHPVVRQIVEEGSTMPYLKLNYVIKELSTKLTEQDIDALIAFITGPMPGSFRDMEWGSLTNDIQEALSVQTVPNGKVAEALIVTYRDESRSQLMRDYALQHVGGFAMYLVHTSGTRTEPLPAFYPNLVAELKSAAADSSKPWAGTALNLLDGVLRAAEERGTAKAGVSVEELIRLAVPVAKNPQAPLNARLPALQVASRRQSPEALNLARQILADSDAHLMLVQSACAVLGQQGKAEDVALLEKLRNQGGRHQSPAARAALERLRALSALR